MDKNNFDDHYKLDLFDSSVISLVGGGGKTTTIKSLASIFKSKGAKILWTTSTAIFKPNKEDYDEIFIGDIPHSYRPPRGSITVYGQYEEGKKLRSNDILKIEEIINRKIFDYVLIEADGSKGKPIKAPTTYEPVISELTTATIGVIGMDSINQNINIVSHRPELLKKILEVESDYILQSKDLIKLALHENGLFKNSVGKKILFLNKVKDNQLDIVKKIEKSLINTDIRVYIGPYKSMQ